MDPNYHHYQSILTVLRVPRGCYHWHAHPFPAGPPRAQALWEDRDTRGSGRSQGQVPSRLPGSLVLGEEYWEEKGSVKLGVPGTPPASPPVAARERDFLLWGPTLGTGRGGRRPRRAGPGVASMGFGAGLKLHPVPAPRLAAEEADPPGLRRRCASRG